MVSVRAVVVDDDELAARAMCDGLARGGIAAEACFAAPAAMARLDRGGVDVVLLDVMLAGADGIAVCGEIVRRWPAIDVLVMSAHGSLDRAVGAVKAGAHDFLTKPFTSDSLVLRIQRLAAERTQARELGELRALVDGDGFGELSGTSPAMQKVRAVLQRIVGSAATVLVTGESGTGKEIVARGLHRHGPRQTGPFVAINCAALPEALLESELFGHVRGAFTDARTDRAGLLAQASGGTVFLDEIGELPAALQPKLLRALEERAVRPVGGTCELPIDVRVVAATQRDLAAEVHAGRFRADLFYRLNVLRVALPALRERGDDVIALARRFAARAAAQERKTIRGLAPAVIDALRAHPWPGNVRELRNCLEHAVAMARTEVLELDDLPEGFGAPAPAPDLGWPTLDVLERDYVDRVLVHVDGNRSAAARVLGIDRRTLLRKLAVRRNGA